MFLLIDKPKGLTSHDVCDYIRKITKEKKVGHSGTLDPNATGLLIIAIGRASTKKLGKLLKLDKKYQAEVFLGEEKDTDDSEGITITRTKDIILPSAKEVDKVLKGFLGKRMQIPPSYSAIKVGGKKSYLLARKGKKVQLKPRKIEIKDIKLIKYQYPYLIFEVEVSSGTYIRSLARDVGQMLGCGGYLKELTRLSIGPYKLKDSRKLNAIKAANWKKYSFSDVL